MRIFVLAVVGMVVGGVPAAGCGGDECAFAACGGDPLESGGSWGIESACGDVTDVEDQLRDICADVELHVGFHAAGTLGFQADETQTTRIYDQAFFAGAMGSVIFPASCFEDDPVPSCDDLEGDTLRCSGSVDTSCRCLLDSRTSTSAAGTWSVNGSRLTLDADDADPVELEFCVERESFTARAPAGEVPAVTYVMRPVIID